MTSERNSSNANNFRASTHNERPPTTPNGRPSPSVAPPRPNQPRHPTTHRPRPRPHKNPDRRTAAIRAGRNLAERYVHLAPHLPPADRALVEHVFAEGRSCVDVARLAGRSPRAIRARLAKLTARLSDPLFAWVVLHEDALPPDLRLIARACILHGRSLADVSRRERITYHRARSLRQALISLARARIVGNAVRPGARQPHKMRAPRTPPASRTPRARPAWRTTSDRRARHAHINKPDNGDQP